MKRRLFCLFFLVILIGFHFTVQAQEEIEKVIQLSSNFSHSIWVTNKGNVYAYGKNDRGQLGNADMSKLISDKPSKINFSLNSDDFIIKVLTSKEHVIALTKNGEIFTFGYNKYGQLGNKKSKDEGYTCIDDDYACFSEYTPNNITDNIDLHDGEQIIDIAIGNFMSIFLTSEGRVFACGLLYLESEIYYHSPRDISAVIANDKIKSVMVETNQILALTVNDEIYYNYRDFTINENFKRIDLFLERDEKIKILTINNIVTTKNRVFYFDKVSYKQVSSQPLRKIINSVDIKQAYSIDSRDSLILVLADKRIIEFTENNVNEVTSLLNMDGEDKVIDVVLDNRVTYITQKGRVFVLDYLFNKNYQFWKWENELSNVMINNKQLHDDEIVELSSPIIYFQNEDEFKKMNIQAYSIVNEGPISIEYSFSNDEAIIPDDNWISYDLEVGIDNQAFLESEKYLWIKATDVYGHQTIEMLGKIEMEGYSYWDFFWIGLLCLAGIVYGIHILRISNEKDFLKRKRY